MRIIKLSAKGRLEIKNVKDDLRVLQNEVGGYIEQHTLAEDMVILCDEDATLKNRSRNPFITSLYGDLVLVGIKNNKWASIPLMRANKLVSMIQGKRKRTGNNVDAERGGEE